MLSMNFFLKTAVANFFPLDNLEPTMYGFTKLEWEHQYYVLDPCTVIDDWLARNGLRDECWEVRKIPELKGLLGSRLYTLTSVSGYMMILLGSQH